MQVQRFQIAPAVYASSGMLSSIAPGKSGFVHVWVEGFPRTDTAKWDLAAAMKQAADATTQARGVPVIRDLVEEAQSAIGIKEARRALLKAKAET